jgi:hypothetical protein
MSASGQFVQFLQRDIVKNGRGRQRKSVSARQDLRIAGKFASWVTELP